MQVVWSVHTAFHQSPSVSRYMPTFDTVIINEGNAWNADLNAIITPVKGIYYVHLQFSIFPQTAATIALRVWGATSFILRVVSKCSI